MPPMPVSVRTVKQGPVPVLVDAVGQAEGSKEVEVRARVAGLIEQQRYTEGDRVKAGAPLFAIERAPFENALATAKAALAQEQSRLEQAQRELKRLKPLAEMQAIAQREADDAATAQRSAEAAVAAAQARVKDAELNLSYTAVTSPIAGVTGRAEKSLGSLVSASDGLLTRVVQTDPIWVRFSFSETEMAQLKAGKAGGGSSSGSASVKLLAPDGTPLGVDGRLNFTGSSVDARLGTVQLRAAFANPELTVLPGAVREGAGAGGRAARLAGAAGRRGQQRTGQDRLDRAGRQGHAHAHRGGRLGRAGLGRAEGPEGRRPCHHRQPDQDAPGCTGAGQGSGPGCPCGGFGTGFCRLALKKDAG